MICITNLYNTFIQVNNNGNLSPGSSFSRYDPENFPFESQPIIAVFWADADTRPVDSGEVWYRVTTATALLQQAKTDIKKAYPSVGDIDYIFIATWNRIGYYSRQTNKVCQFCSFQSIGLQSFLNVTIDSKMWSSIIVNVKFRDGIREKYRDEV